MIRKNKARWLLTTIVIGGLLPAFACNFRANDAGYQPATSAHLRQTLAALDNPTLVAGTQTPAGSPRPAPSPEPVLGLPTPPPNEADTDNPLVPPSPDTAHAFTYITSSGDTLEALTKRFEVNPDQISPAQIIPETTYLPPGQSLTISNTLGEISYFAPLLPDSEIINSPSTVVFDITSYIQDAGGYLSVYTELVGEEQLSGAEIVQRVATEKTVNPRILLAFLEHRSNWVLGSPAAGQPSAYPIGFYAPGLSGLYKELSLTANHLNIAYYAWRIGEYNVLSLRAGNSVRLYPELNAGSAALQNLFAKFYEQGPWNEALYGEHNFIQLHRQMFGDPWQRAAAVEPLLDVSLEQPDLDLPFLPGERWSFTGGPHRVMNLGSPFGALDFGPADIVGGCVVPETWVTAPASGLVTRSGDSTVALDLDGDGYEQTGWVLYFLHIAEHQRVPAGSYVETDDPLGHPSCEGGNATGVHVHMARKYNGEWLAADGPIPFILSGWTVTRGSRPYMGTLTKDDQVVIANPGGSKSSLIVR